VESLETLKEKAQSIARGITGEAKRLDFARAFVFTAICEFWRVIRREISADLEWPVVNLCSVSPALKSPSPLPAARQWLALRFGRAASALDRLEAGYQIGCLYTVLIPDKTRSRFGVYYTPPALTQRLLDVSEEAGADWSRDSVLDPACGGGAFLAPVARRMIRALFAKDPGEVVRHLIEHLGGYEIDPFAAWLSQALLESTVLEVCVAANRRLPILVQVKNALEDRPCLPAYDVVIGNPPYGKIRLDAEQRGRFKRSLYGHANLYGLFTDQALWHVRKGGIVAYVTPTSFLSGNYFKELRKLLLRCARPINIDFVSARAGVFEDVLQETILVTCKEGSSHETGTAHILEALSPTDLTVAQTGEFKLPSDPTMPWIIPRSRSHARLVRRLGQMKYTLSHYGYKVSTGPLVWNRHKSQLRKEPGPGRYPLIWAEAVTSDGSFVFRAEKKNHQPFFEPRPHELWVMVRRPCVLLQRTTAKEQTRRLIAAELPLDFLNERGAVVIENHLNMVVPANGQPQLSPSTIAAVLNSRTLDQVFRCINGSVAVSAYELEALPLPPPQALRRIETMLQDGATREEIEREIERIYAE